MQRSVFLSLQLAFWQNRSISLVDMYTDQGEPSEKCGEINFALDYDFPSQTLKLKLIQVRDFSSFEAGGNGTWKLNIIWFTTLGLILGMT